MTQVIRKWWLIDGIVSKKDPNKIACAKKPPKFLGMNSIEVVALDDLRPLVERLKKRLKSVDFNDSPNLWTDAHILVEALENEGGKGNG